MPFEGIWLMIASMIAIVLFLGLLLCIAFLSRAAKIRKMAAIRKKREIQEEHAKKKHATATGGTADEDIAVIAAAVAAFESKR
jgi:Na+-transporting methylmalonyl-CoA/oxaloacetate decarboxylase gamma subunit